MDNRYSRQIAFQGIGTDGQRRIQNAHICIVGLGALGTAAADRLCRAGVGTLRLIDNDSVELSNLQRQTIYSEADIGVAKLDAAARRLFEINAGVEIESFKCRLKTSNAYQLLGKCDTVLDCTDNIAARHVINDTCHALGIPWIHGAAAGSSGVVFSVVPDGACFRCLYPHDNVNGETADTLGMLGTLTGIIGTLQANEAMKLIVGAKPSDLLMLDIWNNTCETIKIEHNPDCPVCGGGQ